MFTWISLELTIETTSLYKLSLKDPIKRERRIISCSVKLNGEVTGLRAFVGPSTWFKLLIHMILRAGERGEVYEKLQRTWRRHKEKFRRIFQTHPYRGRESDADWTRAREMENICDAMRGEVARVRRFSIGPCSLEKEHCGSNPAPRAKFFSPSLTPYRLLSTVVCIGPEG